MSHLSALKKRIATVFLRVLGWRVVGQKPSAERVVIIAAPHTTNFDFPLLIAYGWYYQVPIAWVGKHTLFKGPFGPFMRALGGVPVRRNERSNLVTELAKELRDGPPRGLVIPTEGSRSRREHWKSGFYHVARAAEAPIVLSYLDYREKVGGFGPCFHLTGKVSEDMDRIRAFYADKQGLYPENFGPVKLADEDIDV